MFFIASTFFVILHLHYLLCNSLKLFHFSLLLGSLQHTPCLFFFFFIYSEILSVFYLELSLHEREQI